MSSPIPAACAYTMVICCKKRTGTTSTPGIADNRAESPRTLPVVDGQVIFLPSALDERQGYQALATPVNGPATACGQVCEADNATVVNTQSRASASASNGGDVDGIDGAADMRSQGFMDFPVNVSTVGTYAMAILRERNRNDIDPGPRLIPAQPEKGGEGAQIPEPPSLAREWEFDPHGGVPGARP